MLKVDRLKVRGVPPLSFEVPDGECLTVEGPSGSGKTLLLRAIADLDPAQGQVFFNGIERGAFSGPRWRQQIRYVAADARWWAPTAGAHFPDLTKARPMLADFDLTDAALDRPIDVLSTGERQRLALMRALQDDPAVLLLDEPTAALDEQRRDLVEHAISKRLAAGAIVLLVSHDAGQIERLSDARLQLGPVNGSARPVEGLT